MVVKAHFLDNRKLTDGSTGHRCLFSPVGARRCLGPRHPQPRFLRTGMPHASPTAVPRGQCRHRPTSSPRSAQSHELSRSRRPTLWRHVPVFLPLEPSSVRLWPSRPGSRGRSQTVMRAVPRLGVVCCRLMEFSEICAFTGTSCKCC